MDSYATKVLRCFACEAQANAAKDLSAEKSAGVYVLTQFDPLPDGG
jgi:hypothetical protein